MKGKSIIQICMVLCISFFSGACGKPNIINEETLNMAEVPSDSIEKDITEAIHKTEKSDELEGLPIHSSIMNDEQAPVSSTNATKEDLHNETTAGYLSDDSSSDDKIVMDIKVTNDAGRIEVIISNDSDLTVTAGDVYQLQKLNNNVWEEVRITTVYTDIGIEIKPGDQYCFSYNLENIVMEDKGTFRVIKSVYSNQREIKLMATFTLR